MSFILWLFFLQKEEEQVQSTGVDEEKSGDEDFDKLKDDSPKDAPSPPAKKVKREIKRTPKVSFIFNQISSLFIEFALHVVFQRRISNDFGIVVELLNFPIDFELILPFEFQSFRFCLIENEGAETEDIWRRRRVGERQWRRRVVGVEKGAPFAQPFVQRFVPFTGQSQHCQSAQERTRLQDTRPARHNSKTRKHMIFNFLIVLILLHLKYIFFFEKGNAAIGCGTGDTNAEGEERAAVVDEIRFPRFGHHGIGNGQKSDQFRTQSHRLEPHHRKGQQPSPSISHQFFFYF